MSAPISVLAMLGDPQRFAAIVEWIRLRGMTVHIATTASDGLKAHAEHGADLVLVGLPLPDHTASTVLGGLLHADANAAVVVVGVDGDVAAASHALDLGARDYVSDPVEGRKDLLFALGLALGVRKSDAQFRVLRAREVAGVEWRSIIGNSSAMTHVLRQLRSICERTLTGAAPVVLLAGEIGTGKRLLAKALHYNGARRTRPFIAVSCASPYLDEQLFGHDRGATLQGAFELANGGTVFLEEVGAIPPELQARLLTALDDRVMFRSGSPHPIHLDVQVVASTRRDLATMVKSGELRADLYHRLSVLMIELPPLRDRGNDVLALADLLLASIAAEHGLPVPTLSDDARLALARHPWPGNACELRNELERVALLVDADVIEPRHVAAQMAPVAIDHHGGNVHVSISGDACPLDDLEREVIRQALLKSNGNVSRAARFLAITRQTMLYRMKKHGFASPTQDLPAQAGQGDQKDVR